MLFVANVKDFAIGKEKPGQGRVFLARLGWMMGLEPTTTGITILDSTN